MKKREREKLADIGNRLLTVKPEPFKLFKTDIPIYGILLKESEYDFAERFLSVSYDVKYEIGKVVITQHGNTWNGIVHLESESGKRYVLVEVPSDPADLIVWRAHIKIIFESAIMLRGKYSDYARVVNSDE